MLPEGFEWCRKAKYEVKVELGCYQITAEEPLLPGFQEKEIEGVKYAVKSGHNTLEQNDWTTSPQKPYIITGTVGERWPVKPSNITTYDIDPAEITIVPLPVFTKDPSDQPFMVARHIPEGTSAKVIPSWAFRDDGSIDETQIMVANSPSSAISHNGGDFVVAKHIDGEVEYCELPEEQRNTKEAAQKYDPRIINGSIMQTTYDHAKTIEEILAKYQQSIQI